MSDVTSGIRNHHGPMPEEQYQAELAEIRGRYPADVMDGPERAAYMVEIARLQREHCKQR